MKNKKTVLAHYYHFCAELLIGTWAFWHGTYRGASPNAPIPAVKRAIFAHAEAEEWRDGPGMNFFFLRSAWPSLTVETRPDWLDRVSTTALHAGSSGGRSWWFDTVLLADRSAAFRGPECGERTQRTAAEAVKGVVERAGRTGFLERGWWDAVRGNVLRFVGLPERTIEIGTRAYKRASRGSPRTGGVEEVVITYISRQGVRRHLVPDDHAGLVRALTELCDRRNWRLNVVAMERLTKEEQLALAAETTVSLDRPVFFFCVTPDLFSFRLTCRFILRLVPRRGSRERFDSSDHDAHNTDLDSHRTVLSRRLRARLRMDDAGSRDETLRRVERHVRCFVFFSFEPFFKDRRANKNHASFGLNVARRLPPNGRGPITLRDSKDRKFPYMVLTSRSSLRTGRMASSHNPLLRTIDTFGLSQEPCTYRTFFHRTSYLVHAHRVSSLHPSSHPLVWLCSHNAHIYQCSCNYAVLSSSLVLCVYLFFWQGSWLSYS